jgi:hypothetical protein
MVALSGLLALPARAQWARPEAAPAASRAALPPAGEEPHRSTLVLAGLGTGVLGLLVGGYAGAAVACGGSNPDEFCGLIGFVLGGAAGEALMLPLGVHLANGRRGNLAAGMAGSALIGLGGVLLALGSDTPWPLLVVPVFQLPISIGAERSTARSRARAAR